MKSICLTTDEARSLMSSGEACAIRKLNTQPIDVLDMAGKMYGKGWIGLMHRDPHGKLYNNRGTTFGCRYGKMGDMLWVREKWAVDGSLDRARAAHEDILDGIGYGPYYEADAEQQGAGHVWRPAIMMPRWCSRLTVQIEAVRCWRRYVSEAKNRNIPSAKNPWCWNIFLKRIV